MKNALKYIKVRRLKNVVTLILVYEKENGEYTYKRFSFIDEIVNNYSVEVELDELNEPVNTTMFNCKILLS